MALNAEYPPEQRGSCSPEELALLLREGEKWHYEGGEIPIDVINVLPQPRRTFGEIRELALSIAENGLINPLNVARLSDENCGDYLEVINRLWQTELKTGDLKSCVEEGKNFFYILIAGERRYRALRYLEEEGCDKEHNGKNCLECHFPNRLIEVRRGIDIPPLQAIFLQASENTHMKIPVHEEARFHYNLFTILREVNEKYPLAAFARKVGRCESTIRKAIKFCELPLDIQRYVEQGALVYGKALEIDRLIDIGISEENLGWVMKMAMVQNQTVEEFRAWVTNYIGNITSGQTMLEIFTEAQVKAMRRVLIRRTVAQEYIQAIWQRIHYVQEVIRLLNEGKLGEDDSPFSIKSPIRVSLAFINQMEQLLPLLKRHLSKAKSERVEEVIEEVKPILKELESVLPEGGSDLDPYSRSFNRDESSPVD